MQLLLHPDHLSRAVAGLTVAAGRSGSLLTLTFTVDRSHALSITDAAAVRTDELWRHTCFEAFVMGADGAYHEFNFAPSGAWAAYAFDSYRAGMQGAEAAPVIAWDGTALTVMVAVDVPGDWRISLSAVIEETDGHKSYWALAHPDGAPDFHDPACFVLTLPASRTT